MNNVDATSHQKFSETMVSKRDQTAGSIPLALHDHYYLILSPPLEHCTP